MASMHEVDTWSSDTTICRWIASVPIETGEQKDHVMQSAGSMVM